MAELMDGSSLAREVMLSSVMIATKTVSYICLVFTLLDWLTALQYEKEYIWTKQSCKVKWQYLWSRYIGILGQILNIVAVNRLYPSTTVPWRVCYAWHIFQLISGHSIFVMLELTSALRVIALYNRTWKIYLGVGTLLLSEFTTNMVIAFRVFNEMQMLGSCGMKDTPVLIAVVPIIKAVTQIILLTLTLYKCREQTAPLVTLIRRDGSFSFLSVIAVLIATTIQFVLAGMQHLHAEQAYHLLFPIFLFTMAFTNCKVIRNMEVYARSQAYSINGECLDPTISEYSSSPEVAVSSVQPSHSAALTTVTRRTATAPTGSNSG